MTRSGGADRSSRAGSSATDTINEDDGNDGDLDSSLHNLVRRRRRLRVRPQLGLTPTTTELMEKKKVGCKILLVQTLNSGVLLLFHECMRVCVREGERGGAGK